MCKVIRFPEHMIQLVFSVRKAYRACLLVIFQSLPVKLMINEASTPNFTIGAAYSSLLGDAYSSLLGDAYSSLLEMFTVLC